MLFKSSKKRRLEALRYRVCMFRAGMEVQKEHAVSLAQRIKPEDFPKTVGNIYDYIIKELMELEKI